jgi:hypothetical protein
VLSLSLQKYQPPPLFSDFGLNSSLKLAPITVLEFARLADEAGGKLMITHLINMARIILVPPGVLSVLPGYGATVGKAIVSNPLIRKVDITVRASFWLSIYKLKALHRLGQILDAHSAA